MKRARSTSPLTSHNETPASVPTTKFQRIESQPVDGKDLLWCTLEPMCAPPNEPTCLRSLDELEAHYTQYHAYVCRADGCTCVFSTQHYLNLHQTELHDPLAQIHKERGEPIYQCFVETCTHVATSPNQRKRHLIQDHHYDDKFFFAVTKVGIGGQLRAWGSLSASSGNTKKQDSPKMGIDSVQTENSGGGQRARRQATKPQRSSTPVQQTADATMEDLTDTMKSVSLVPSAVRFGRGGANKGGFEHPSHKKNASLSDITTDLKREMLDDDDYDMDETSDKEDAPGGVRFAEEVAIRFLSPIGRRFNEGRKGKKRGGRKAGRAGGIHSDDESGGRSTRADSRPQNFKGRGRGKGRNANAERGAVVTQT